jgi:2-polyprenyl-6-methoxyphenol hydroxylase-like FAD-dependent oxidoreductase
MFERIGIVDALIASGVRTTAMEMFDAGHLLARVSLDEVDSPFPFSVTTAQTQTERILTERLSQLGVSVERGLEALSFEQDASGVDYALRHLDGREELGRCDWIVGTDGARSTVRHAMGSKLVGSFKGQRFLLGDVDAAYECDRNAMQTFFSPDDGPLLVFPMVGERLRLIAEITDTPTADRDHPEDTSIERFQSIVDRRTTGMELVSARWITVFEIHHAQVPAYRAGRAFLAGDAAHVHSPAGGQGMNTGMQDAFNLGWKLALAASGAPGAEALLESYHAERHPIAARVIRDSTILTNVGTVHGKLRQKLRNGALRLGSGLAPIQHKLAAETSETDLAYRGSSAVAGRQSGRLRPGDAAPDVPGTNLRRFLHDEVGHAVLHFPGRTSASTVRPLAHVRNILVSPVETIDHAFDAAFDAVIHDGSGAVAGRYGMQAGGVAAVRPDGYLGFLGRLQDLNALEAYLGSCAGSHAAVLPEPAHP